MTVFDHYAEYYDLLYATKDYAREVEYVCSLFARAGVVPKTILDIGCGTGSHALHFAQRGYDVVGVDRSQRMIGIARQKVQELGAQVDFVEADICAFESNKPFEAVVALFHVMNYLTGSDDLLAGFRNATSCLLPGGLFVFDSWYGPAVLSDLPRVGVRRFENQRLKVTRIAEPVLHPNRSVVDVNYEIFVQDKGGDKTEVITETHPMRYFFKTEIEELLKPLGLELLVMEEWLTGREAGLSTFGVCFVGQKRVN